MTPDDLVEIEAIKQLKYRYVRLLDIKAWDELASCFVEDATAAYSGGQLSFDGRDAIMAFLRGALGSTERITSHAVGQPEIELTGPDAATGIWALHDLVIMPEHTLRGASFYEDRYVKVDGAWRISHTGYRRVYEEIGPRSPEAKLTATWWESDGRSELASRPLG